MAKPRKTGEQFMADINAARDSSDVSRLSQIEKQIAKRIVPSAKLPMWPSGQPMPPEIRERIKLHILRAACRVIAEDLR